MGVFGPESEDYDEHTETPSSCYGCKQKMDRMTGFVKENLKKKMFCSQICITIYICSIIIKYIDATFECFAAVEELR